MRENLGDFQKDSKMLMLLSPATTCPPIATLHETNDVLHNDLKNKPRIKYGKSNTAWIKFQAWGGPFLHEY